MLIADSSARVEYLRGTGSPAHLALHLQCRSVGVTPLGLVDCTIAAMAMRAGLPVLHHDRDVAAIAPVAGLTQAPGSLV
jgi:hypothetical protein